jgi:hypothetical protein
MEKEKEKEKKYKMEITDRRVWLSIEKTVQLRQYEPIKITAGMSGDIPDNKKAKIFYKEMFEQLKKQIDTDLTNLINDE